MSSGDASPTGTAWYVTGTCTSCLVNDQKVYLHHSIPVRQSLMCPKSAQGEHLAVNRGPASPPKIYPIHHRLPHLVNFQDPLRGGPPEYACLLAEAGHKEADGMAHSDGASAGGGRSAGW